MMTMKTRMTTENGICVRVRGRALARHLDAGAASTLRPWAIRAAMRVVPAEQAGAVVARRGTPATMYVAARLAGEAVGDPLLEAVADLDPDASLLERQQDQQAVVLALLADAAAVVLEQLRRRTRGCRRTARWSGR